jgi:hypothetical protein
MMLSATCGTQVVLNLKCFVDLCRKLIFLAHNKIWFVALNAIWEETVGF